MGYKREMLPNGGMLCYTKNNISKTTLIDIVFDSGARCDSIAGLAHFTEHMFFSGTKTMNKEEVTKKYFDFINVNAYTNSCDITFTGNIFTREFAQYLSTVSMMINESTFSQKNIDQEIGVVQQEIARSKDKFDRKASSFNKYCICRDKVNKDSVLGYEDTVASIKTQDIRAFVGKHFVRENAEVYVTSPLSYLKVKKLVQRNLISKLPSSPKYQHLPLYYSYVVDDSFFEIKHENIDKCYVYINFFNTHNVNEHEYKKKFGLLLNILNDISEGINKEIRLKKSLVYGGNFVITYNDRESVVTFCTECDKKNINELLTTIAEYIDDKLENGFTLPLLDKAKRELDYSDDCSEPHASNGLSKLYNYKYYGKIINSKKLKKIVQKTTLDEINAIYRELFSNNRVAMSIYGDVNKKEIISKKEFNKLYKNHK